MSTSDTMPPMTDAEYAAFLKAIDTPPVVYDTITRRCCACGGMFTYEMRRGNIAECVKCESARCRAEERDW